MSSTLHDRKKYVKISLGAHMKKLIIDFDDVICNNEFVTCYNEFFHTNKKHSDFGGFYVDSAIKDLDTRRAFGEYVVKRNFYKNATIKEGAVEAVEKLSKKYSVYICTAYYMDYVRNLCGTILEQKYTFIAEHIPTFDMSKIIFTNSKSVVNGDIMIDDNVNNLITNNACTKLLFTAEHNESIEKEELIKHNIIRVNGWQEILKLLEADVD